MNEKTIVAFDTSAINSLADDPNCTVLLPKICSGFHVLLSATSAGEMIAAPDALRRSKLLALCKELMQSGDYIHNAYHLLQILACDFEVSPTFDWRLVNIKFQEAKDQLRNGTAFDDSESQSVRDENREDKSKFEAFYKRFHPLYDHAFAQPGAIRPANLGESVERLRKSGSFDKMASVLYAYVSGQNPKSDPPPTSAVQRFLHTCPPFYALLLGLCAARYARNLKPSGNPNMKAGALDTSMATCLPYCQIFVTNDTGMRNCFKEVGHLADLRVRVTSYDRFRQLVI